MCSDLVGTRVCRRGLVRDAGFLVGLAIVPAAARSATRDLHRMSVAVRNLKPGEYLWFPEVAPAGPVLLVVALKTQRAYVYRNGVPIGVSTISSGKEGYETPTGVFTILQKHVDHKSNLYDDAPMPFMQRLTWDGVALHAGNLPGYPASHGCIRLPEAFARLLYGVTRLGMTVLVANDQTIPRVAPTPAFLRENAKIDEAEEGEEWTPEAAPEGPISILISAPDQRILVLRNGVRIGAARVAIDEAVISATAYILASIDSGRFRWLRLALPGRSEDAGKEVTVEERARLRLPSAFQNRLRAILGAGTVAIVTPDSLASGSAGERITVISSEEGP
ncbi:MULTISPECIES: L,D-transpeptidase [Sphingobium]|uniref:L,D-transpeptidase n=3 Tax=Sphingobium TaxID=165695 RepID=A0A5B8CM80_SPHSA|nr:L,D-transpeptidase [Sphingobium fuliginis ATCC 27551]QNG49130.1 L,D-transpeptidase [Sphingobium yanoikuyae]